MNLCDWHHGVEHAVCGLSPKIFRYVSRWSDDLELRARLKWLASERLRASDGAPVIGPAHPVASESIALNHKKLFRLYHEERLTVQRRGGRKRLLGTRSPMGCKRCFQATYLKSCAAG